MRLQIAVDTGDAQAALALADAIADVIDIFEVGTPLLMLEGTHVIRELKKGYPHMCVLADAKIMDGGALETRYVCEAGADIVTTLAVSDNATISEVIECAHGYGREVMVDLMNVRDISARSQELVAMGADYIAVHTAFDVQAQGRTPLEDLQELVSAISSDKAAVAGGVKQSSVSRYVALQPAIVIAGAALYGAPDVRQAVLDMKGALI